MILLLAFACASPGVLVVVLDTTRADVVEAGLLPEGSRVYTAAYSAAPWTSSSTYTLTTGRYPDRPAAQRPPWDVGRLARIPEGYPVAAALTWPERVYTDHVVPAWVLGAEELPYRSAMDTAAADLDLGGLAYVHDLGPHHPYEAPVRGLRRPHGDELFRLVDDDIHNGIPYDISPGLGAWAWHAYHATAEDNLSRAGVLVADAVDRGWTVILTSDHGEALGEGGIYGHAQGLGDEQTHVPLLVWGPGVVPGSDDQPVPATCVAETVRAVLGETSGAGCDLRIGDVRGEVVSGMLVDGVWVERRPGEES